MGRLRGLELDAKVELFLGLIPLGLMHVEGVLADEVRHLAGDKHARKGEAQVGRRYGSSTASRRLRRFMGYRHLAALRDAVFCMAAAHSLGPS